MSGQKLVEGTPEGPLLPRQPEVNIGTAGHVDHGKCLRWDQYVLVNGLPLTGGEVQELVAQDGRLLTKFDGGEVYEFGRNDVVSIDTKFEAKKASSLFYMQDYRGPIYKVRTGTGRTIAVTPEHPLLINRGGKVVWVKSSELRPGDHVAFLSQIPLTEGYQFPDPFSRLQAAYEIVRWQDYQRIETITEGFRVFAALKPREIDQLRILAGASNDRLCREAGIDYKTWKRILDGSRPIQGRPKERLLKWFSETSVARLSPGEYLAVQRRGSARHIRRLKEFDMDDDLVRWLAFVWSEGSSGKGFVEVTQTVEIDMLNSFLRITRDKLGAEVHSYGGGIYRINNTPLVDYLRFKFGFVPGNKLESAIQTWVCRLTTKQRAIFLRWFLTLDGEFNTKAGQVSVSQANPKNIVVISYLLGSFGIIGRFGTVSRKVKGGRKTYHRLSISGRRNLQLFATNIGFEAPRKQKALIEYLGRISIPSKESNLSMPVDARLLRSVLRGSGLTREGFRSPGTRPGIKASAWYKAYESSARTGRISRPKLLTLVQSIQDHLGLIDDSLSRLSKDWKQMSEHLSTAAIPLEQIAREMGMSRKKLTRILDRPTAEERATVVDFVSKRTLERLRELGPALDQLAALATTPLEFDSVRAVEVEPYEGKIYDLTVPEHSNFVAGTGALIAHNTSLTQAITGIWASAHSEELKRGITIKVGYADAAFYRCAEDHGVASYSTSAKCPVCGKKTGFLRAVSFVDCPGHESLMTNMLAGAFLMDGALLVIAANEPVPKPQTREHLQALQMLGMKNIVIAQNKIDLVTDQEAERNHEQIQKFVSGTVAGSAPIIPISAQQQLNIDALIQAIEDVIPTPKRDAGASPLMYVVRSFDVNRPGNEIGGLVGGVLGGSLTRGELKVGDEIELRPGMVEERSGKFIPVITRVSSLETGAGQTERVGPGGLVAVGTHLDPTFVKGDQMVGSVIGRVGTLPDTLEHVTLDVTLLETAVGSADLVKVEKVKLGETVRLNLGTASSLAVATSVRGDVVELDLKKPVSTEMGMRAAISRRIAERWRLIGSGVLK
ncbi:MAG: translation initiation factor IF-2 subunit gamma [Nitrososphaerota archaeon]|nr:translation initiation factor IF-2 subunit gamma [Nitrososphaerota archaeon]